MTPEKEQEYRAEAERLAELPRDDQRQLIAQRGTHDPPRQAVESSASVPRVGTSRGRRLKG